jgi:hypothetical protein
MAYESQMTLFGVNVKGEPGWFLAVLGGIGVGVRTAVLASAALTRRLRRGGEKKFVGFAFSYL